MMLSAVRAVFPLVFFVLWPSGTISLLLRARITQRAYLRRFDPVDGHTLDSMLDSSPIGVPHVLAAIREVMWEQQDDPEREALRREMWGRFRWMAAWIFGFPLTVAAIMALIVSTGHGAWLLG